MVAVLHVNFDKRRISDVSMFDECASLAEKLMMLAGKMAEELVHFNDKVPRHVIDENTSLMAHLAQYHTTELDSGIDSVHEMVSDLIVFIQEDVHEADRQCVEQIHARAKPILRVIK